MSVTTFLTCRYSSARANVCRWLGDNRCISVSIGNRNGLYSRAFCMKGPGYCPCTLRTDLRGNESSYDLVTRCLTRVHNGFMNEVGCYMWTHVNLILKTYMRTHVNLFKTDMRTHVNFIWSIYEDSDTVRFYMRTIYWYRVPAANCLYTTYMFCDLEFDYVNVSVDVIF